MINLFSFIFLLIIFAFLNILDVHSTYQVVKVLSFRAERNPIARFFMKKFGVLKGMLFIKSVLLIVFPLMIYYFLYEPFEIILTLFIVCFFFIAVVWNNYKIAKRYDYLKKR